MNPIAPVAIRIAIDSKHATLSGLTRDFIGFGIDH